MQKINFSDLYIGMKVQDEKGLLGTVVEIKDEHNVFVEHDNNGGSGLHCLVEDCAEIVEINNVEYVSNCYSPLYYPQSHKCQHCGNNNYFEIWTELEYSDGSDEPNTSNRLIETTYVRCEECGEIL